MACPLDYRRIKSEYYLWTNAGPSIFVETDSWSTLHSSTSRASNPRSNRESSPNTSGLGRRSSFRPRRSEGSELRTWIFLPGPGGTVTELRQLRSLCFREQSRTPTFGQCL